MTTTEVDLIIIGAGPAGLAAAMEAKKSGVERVLILERDREPGGILQQCIHNGFGLHAFGEELTGPEYAHRFIVAAKLTGVELKLNTTVLSVFKDKTVLAVNETDGLVQYRSKAVIFAMGCRERSRGALNIPGSRPAGIYTAGAAQRFVNMEGYLPGNRIVILGSGDIGLIMARRLTLEGAKVLMVCELLPYSSGLNRNIEQCLNDFEIPLKLSHTVVRIHGKDRLEAVTIAKVDENRKPIPESFEIISCDTLLLSVGLIPENELSIGAGVEIDPVTGGPVVNECMETSAEGLFACGNVVHVHDLVDNVTLEGQLAGLSASKAIKGKVSQGHEVITSEPGNGIRYIVPQNIRKECLQDKIKLYFRVDKPYQNRSIVVKDREKVIQKKNKQKLAPGEMEHVVLTREELSSLRGDKLTIELV